LSAGAAYTTVLLSLYPDVFAAGSSFEGLAFGCTETCQESPPQNTPQQWGTLVRNAYPGYTGSYPRFSIWEGTADTIVAPANQPALVAQWTNVTGASSTPTKTDTVNGAAHAEYADGSGAVTVETYTITGMTHAVAIDPSHGCGTTAAYFSDEGICSAMYSAQFFGITTAPGSDAGSGAGSSSGTGSGAGSGSSAGAGSGSLAGSGSGAGANSDVSAGLTSSASGPGCCVTFRSASDSWLALAVIGVVASIRRRRSLPGAAGPRLAGHALP
jgi:Esterase PHB depolymerase